MCLIRASRSGILVIFGESLHASVLQGVLEYPPDSTGRSSRLERDLRALGWFGAAGNFCGPRDTGKEITYEKNRIFVIRPLGQPPLVSDAHSERYATSIHRPCRGGRRNRAGRRVLSRASFCTAARFSISVTCGYWSQDEQDRNRDWRH